MMFPYSYYAHINIYFSKIPWNIYKIIIYSPFRGWADYFGRIGSASGWTSCLSRLPRNDGLRTLTSWKLENIILTTIWIASSRKETSFIQGKPACIIHDVPLGVYQCAMGVEEGRLPTPRPLTNHRPRSSPGNTSTRHAGRRHVLPRAGTKISNNSGYRQVLMNWARR